LVGFLASCIDSPRRAGLRVATLRLIVGPVEPKQRRSRATWRGRHKILLSPDASVPYSRARRTPEPVLEARYFRPGRCGGKPPSYALDAPRESLARASAVLGALACAGRESVDAVCGGAVDPRAVRLAGGWARSPGWVAIKEAVNGYPAELITEPEVTAVGAALLAATARGWDPDAATALGGASALENASSFRLRRRLPDQTGSGQPAAKPVSRLCGFRSADEAGTS
jgi:hypothetical protein